MERARVLFKVRQTMVDSPVKQHTVMKIPTKRVEQLRTGENTGFNSGQPDAATELHTPIMRK